MGTEASAALSLPGPVLGACIDHLLASSPVDDPARDLALVALIDSLARAFDAARIRACSVLLGPVVPGASMTHGARVPGTTYVLDPGKAAFDLGTLVRWVEPDDAATPGDGAALSDLVGALVVVGDYLSRAALALGRPPHTVRQLLDGMVRAHEVAVALQRMDEPVHGRLDRATVARVASAAAVAVSSGASRSQVARALEDAWYDGRPLPRGRGSPGRAGREAVAMGDAASRAVCLAFRAIAAESTDGTAPDDLRASTAESVRSDRWIVATGAGGAGVTGAAAPWDREVVGGRFEASVARHFPPAQATKLTALLADRARLESLPINELVSLTVRN